ncbi:hypothetical protein [Methylorubrum aminovorans]|nr:hypothetical protein [Methylorubrum aminovorans]
MAMGEAVEPDPYSELRGFLREQIELAPSRKPSAYEAVKAVLPEIKKLKAKGKTDAEVRELLERMGIKLSLGTFRQYVRNAVKEAKGESVKRTRGKAKAKPKGNAPPTRSVGSSDTVEHGRRPGPAAGQTTAEPRVAPRDGALMGKEATSHRLSDDNL